jgi:hypothetical protein
MFNIEGMMKIINKEESIVARFRGLFEAEWSHFKWWRLYREVDMSSMMVFYFTRRVATPLPAGVVGCVVVFGSALLSFCCADKKWLENAKLNTRKCK